MANPTVSILDQAGRFIGGVEIEAVEDGWYYGQLNGEIQSEDLRRDLAWYDEVVSQQMLSFLDEATAAVQRHELIARFSDDTHRKIYALHLERSGSTSFRISPVPPPQQNRLSSSSILK